MCAHRWRLTRIAASWSSGRWWRHHRHGRAVLLAGAAPTLLASATFDYENSLTDGVPRELDDVMRAAVKHQHEHCSGWQRVRSMFTTEEDGSWSPEVGVVQQTALLAGVLGMLWGGLAHGQTTASNYKERNVATLYESNMLANRNMSDRLVVGFFKGGAHIAWRLVAFTCIFQCSALSLALFYDSISPGVFCAAGFITGVVLRLNRGIKAILAAGTLTGLMGVLIGVVLYLFATLSGISLQEFRCFLYTQQYHRIKKKQKDHVETAKMVAERMYDDS